MRANAEHNSKPDAILVILYVHLHRTCSEQKVSDWSKIEKFKSEMCLYIHHAGVQHAQLG